MRLFSKVSPLLCASLCFWTGCAASLWYGRIGAPSWVYLGCFLGIVAALFLFARFRSSADHGFRPALMPLLLALGCACGLFACAQQESRIRALEGLTQDCTIVALEDFKPSQYGQYGSVRVSFALPQDSSKASYRVRLYVNDSAPLYYGQRIEASLSFSAPNELTFDSYWAKGLVGSAVLKEVPATGWQTPLSSLRAHYIESLGSEGFDEVAGLLAALSCGYRVPLLDSQLYTSFQIAGVAHLVAISGAHLSIMIAVLNCVLVALRMGRKARCLFEIVFIILFLFSSAFPVSAFRAAVMASLSLLSFFARRRSYAQNALGLCILCFIIADPFTALSASFSLSALSTAGIVVFSSPFMQRIAQMKSRALQALAGVLVPTFSANLTTFLLGGALFSQVSLVSFVSNALLALPFTPLCALSVFACFTSYMQLPVSLLLQQAALALGRVCAHLIGVLSSLPCAAVPFSAPVELALALSVLVAAAVLLSPLMSGTEAQAVKKRYDVSWRFAVREKRRGRLSRVMPAVILGVLLLVLGSGALSYIAPVRLSVLNVGQGDALLIKDRGAVVLVDTGNQVSLLKKELAEQGVYHIDSLFITHPDDDHCGALADVLALVSVEAVYVHEDLLTCDCAHCTSLIALLDQKGARIQSVAVGDSVTLARSRIRVLSPSSFIDKGGNQDSLCLLLEVDADNDGTGDYSALLTGDAESETLEDLVKAQRLSSVDLLKVGHHGSKIALSKELLACLQPSCALISVGQGNRYGHPAAETLELLDEAGIACFRTDVQGRIVCTFKDDGLYVRADG